VRGAPLDNGKEEDDGAGGEIGHCPLGLPFVALLTDCRARL
jgi:hypothetical protein